MAFLIFHAPAIQYEPRLGDKALVVAAPTDWPAEVPRWLWAVRWMENEVPLVVANRSGGSRIWHAGRPRPEAGDGEAEVISAEVSIGGANEGLRCRRSAWYTT